MLYRLGFNICVGAVLLLLPWPAFVVLLLAGCFLYDYYWEALVWAVLIDVFSSTAGSGLYFYTVISCLMLLSAQWAKPHIRFYD